MLTKSDEYVVTEENTLRETSVVKLCPPPPPSPLEVCGADVVRGDQTAVALRPYDLDNVNRSYIFDFLVIRRKRHQSF